MTPMCFSMYCSIVFHTWIGLKIDYLMDFVISHFVPSFWCFCYSLSLSDSVLVDINSAVCISLAHVSVLSILGAVIYDNSSSHGLCSRDFK